MIISKTPFRISFFGGGTDHPVFSRVHGGACLSTTINKYCYVSCRALPSFFSHKTRLVYSQIENITHHSEIQHPAVKAVLSYLEEEAGLEIHHDGDLPARSGLGSSSSFTVGLINAIRANRGLMSSKQYLADTAIHIEQQLIRESVGSQDQVASAFGGFNRINFLENGSFVNTPIILNEERLKEFKQHLMLIYTGKQRFAEKIEISKISNIKGNQKALLEMKEMVDEGINILTSPTDPIEKFGELLNQSWELKKSLSNEVSFPELDSIYSTAMANGAIGGKLLGAGGGGFFLFFVKNEMQANVKQALAPLIHVPFDFETQGSSICVYQP